MKFGMMIVLVLAGLFVSAPAANAQSSVDVHIGNGGHYGGGWGRHDGGSIDVHIGTRRGGVYRGGRDCDHRGSYCDHRGPVYRDGRNCDRYDGCNDRDYDYRPRSIQVSVIESVPVYDHHGRYMGESRRERWVNAYWNPRRGAYTYIDRQGRECIVNRY